MARISFEPRPCRSQPRRSKHSTTLPTTHIYNSTLISGNKLVFYKHSMRNDLFLLKSVVIYAHRQNRVRTVRPHRAPPTIHQEVVPLLKKLLYFFIVAPGRRWHVKKKIKKMLNQWLQHARLLLVRLFSIVLLKVKIFFSFFKDHFVFRH